MSQRQKVSKKLRTRKIGLVMYVCPGGHLKQALEGRDGLTCNRCGGVMEERLSVLARQEDSS